MHNARFAVLLAVLAIFFLGAASASAEILYTITDLGCVGPASSGHDLNEAAQVVGDGTPTSSSHAFLWYDDGDDATPDRRELGTLGPVWPWYTTTSKARGINERGQVTGWSFDGEQRYAFLWEDDGTATGRMTSIGALAESSVGKGINDHGQIVGYTDTAVGDDVANRAFVWQDDGDAATEDMHALGTLGGSHSYAEDINNAGQVVGYSYDAASSQRAFLWNAGDAPDVLTDLGDLGGTLGRATASAINDAGQVVGASRAPEGDRAFLWQDGLGMRSLGTLGMSSHAYDINNHGQVVGFFASSSGNRAFLWDDGTMWDLNTRLTGDGAGEWTLVHAHAVNDAGQIVGQGIRERAPGRAFLLTPVEVADPAVPEPASCLLWLVGLGGAIFWRRRRSASRG